MRPKKNQEDEDYDDFSVETKFPHPGHHLNTPSNNPYYEPSNIHPKLPVKNYNPVGWEDYFQQLVYLEDVTIEIMQGTSIFRAGHQGALYFCIHGAGHSAQSFALMAKQVRKFGTVIAFDLKGHGHSKNIKHLQDMSIETLIEQTIYVLQEVMKMYAEQNVIMIGHSLGGSICCRVTERILKEQLGKRVQGMIIVDVVEGTAMEALPFMISVLNNRPKEFGSPEEAVKWSIMSGTLKRLESAKVSIPPQLLEKQSGQEKKYEWKVDLMRTEKYWKGWFTGLTASFLNVRIPKTLVLAERERLDKELMIAQMQGKFKLSVLQNVGHSVQEDDYKGITNIVHELVSIFRIPQTKAQEQIRNNVGLAKFHPDLKPY